jgi:hypothetical protein
MQTTTDVTVQVPPDELDLLDQWRAKKRPRLSRAEAILRLVEVGVYCEPYVAGLLAHLEHVAELEQQKIQETIAALRNAVGEADALEPNKPS